MINPELTRDEDQRLKVLEEFHILDTEPETDFDDITAIASHICNTPISLISLIDTNRQWFKSKIGLPASETPRDISFCGHAIHDESIFEIPDASKDERFFDNPLVTGDPHIRFYAGAPLITNSGARLGTLCVIDRSPRNLTPAQTACLTALSKQVVRQMEFRQKSKNLADMAERLTQTLAFKTAVLHSPDIAMISVTLDGEIVSFSSAAEKLLATTSAEAIFHKNLMSFFSDIELQQCAAMMSEQENKVMTPDLSLLTYPTASGMAGCREWTMLCGDGSTVVLDVGLNTVLDSSSKIIGYLVVLKDISALKVAELALQESHQFLETLIANLPVGIYCKRMTPEDRPHGGQYVIWNAAAERMSGMHASFVVGKNESEVHPIEVVKRHAEHDRMLLETKLPQIIPQYRWTLADGTARLLRMTSIPMLDQLGEVEFTLGIAEDMTDLLREQKAVMLSKAELEAVNDASPIGLFRIDLSGNCSYVNRAFQTITGFEPDACLGQGWLATVHPDELVTLKQNWIKEVSETGKYSGTHRCRHRSGQTLYVRVNTASVIVNGEVVGCIGTLEDITARREATMRLEASEERIRLITNNIPGTVGYINANQVFEFCNQKYLSMLGLDPAVIVGQTMRQAFGEHIYGIVLPRVSAVLAGENQSFERSIHIKGQLKHHQCEYIANVDQDGSVLGFFALVTDITDRKNAENKLSNTEQRLRAITANIPALVAHIDKNERYLFVNDKLAEQFKKPASEIIGFSLADIQPPQLFAANKHYVDKVLAGETTIFESQSNISGTNRYYQVTYIPELDQAERVSGFYAMVIDITERKINELNQAASEKRIKTITNNIPVSIGYIDRALRFQFVNNTLCRWTGATQEQLIGKFVKDVLDKQAYEERSFHFERVLSGEQSEFLQISDLADGHHVLQSTYIPDIDEDGTVIGFYTLSSDITDLKKREQELTELARIDTLTGLKNRAALFETICEGIARSKRANKGLLVMFLDIDYFKTINDTLGHATGDLVLQEFARRLMDSVRTTDTVCRLGGDEFVIVLEEINAVRDAHKVIEKVLKNIRLPWLVDLSNFEVSSSIGAVYDRDYLRTPEELLKIADDYLYKAKQAGRNQYKLNECG